MSRRVFVPLLACAVVLGISASAEGTPPMGPPPPAQLPNLTINIPCPPIGHAFTSGAWTGTIKGPQQNPHLATSIENGALTCRWSYDAPVPFTALASEPMPTTCAGEDWYPSGDNWLCSSKPNVVERCPFAAGLDNIGFFDTVEGSGWTTFHSVVQMANGANGTGARNTLYCSAQKRQGYPAATSTMPVGSLAGCTATATGFTCVAMPPTH